MSYPFTLAAALALACVCLFAQRLRAGTHHRRWISVAVGVSVATVFADLLPEISENQAKFLAHSEAGFALFPEQAVYLAAMLGFVLFFGLEYMMRESASLDEKPSGVFFSLQITAFAGYYCLISYLLVHNVWENARSLILYSFAMAFHLLLVDHALAQERHSLYVKRGRWILAAALVAGWIIGVFVSMPDQWLARIIGFVSGGVIMNSLVVELPEGRGGRFWYFALSAGVYALVLLSVLK
jgi:hypothetical protein